MAVEGNVLKVASGTVFVAEATTCTLMAEDGVVTNLEGLPSKPVEFGSYIFQMKDSVPPAILGFLPSAGAGSVHLAFSDTQPVFLLWRWRHSQNCRRYFAEGDCIKAPGLQEEIEDGIVILLRSVMFSVV